MDVIVHYPTDKQNLELLHKQVAIEHAKFVVDTYPNKLFRKQKIGTTKKKSVPNKTETVWLSAQTVSVLFF